ncbi:non-homologous end joining protein Ku [Tabrizicola sp.]|uniref:non-homologous end joining protein Ku n=1 Tax=Tabrizicola sp. TaxID=2005166 RepID=UPI002FDC8443
MAPRASWKGRMRLGEIAFGVKLYTAATTSDRIALHMINRRTGNRLRNELVDAGTGKPVADGDEVMGYEIDSGDYVLLEAEEIAAAVPDSDKTLSIESFLPCADIDTLYFDRPYYLAPADPASVEAFAVLRDGMERKKVAALARTVLFRRLRTLLIRPEGAGFIANTLNFDYEVRSAERAFTDIPKIEIKGEMLDLAEHIIDTKLGDFDPQAFDDRYDAALAELVKAKLEGRPPPRRKEAPREKVVDLMAALRESAKAAKGRKPAAKVPKRKAG